MRRFIRPRGAFSKRLALADPAFTHDGLVKGLADGTLETAPPKQPAGDLVTDTGVVAKLPPPVPAWPVRYRWWLAIILILLVLLLFLGLAAGLPLLALAAAIAGVLVLIGLANSLLNPPTSPQPGVPSGPGRIEDPAAALDLLRHVPASDSFHFVETDPVVIPASAGGTQVVTGTERTSPGADAVTFSTVTTFTPGAAGADTAQAKAFRAAATKLEQRLTLKATDKVRTPFDVAKAKDKLTNALDPLKSFPRRVAASVKFSFDPKWLLEPEHLVPAMAYPDFDDPMYEKLRDISSELLLPNLKLIPPNSITLLVTNPPFIEAYLTGLNCEFGKELRWREYPTDRRGSYFRQFWDTRGILAAPSGETASETSERAKDITPLDTWPSVSLLGDHRNPKRPSGVQVVLTVRGDLLKKYRNTLIYAQKAHLARDRNGNPAPQSNPVIATVASEADIEREIKFPVFRASVDPDIRFYGFDLTIAQARGAPDPQSDTDDWGYYFIIQQLPGEPRFGMDVSFSPDDDSATPITWNDLSWDRFPEGQTFIDTSVLPQGFVPAGPGEGITQWGSDSARMAAILFQAPVMIAVHAKEMLEGL
jgi:hypothetical protein